MNGQRDLADRRTLRADIAAFGADMEGRMDSPVGRPTGHDLDAGVMMRIPTVKQDLENLTARVETPKKRTVEATSA